MNDEDNIVNLKDERDKREGGLPPNHVCWHCRRPIEGITPGSVATFPAGQYHPECYEERGRAFMALAKQNEEHRKENQRKQLEEEGGPPLCHCCGESCLLGDHDEECGLVDAHVSGGYWSTPGNGEGSLDDTVRYTFNICEFCLDWLFGCFTQPLVRHDYMTEEKIDEPWMPAEQRIVEEGEWRRYPEAYRNEAVRRAKLRQPVWVDFNAKDEEGRVRLNTEGTLASLDGRVLKEGNHLLVTDGDVYSLGVVEKSEGSLVARLLRKPF